PFNSEEKIIEYRIIDSLDTLVSMKINDFADELSSNSSAPGGGSVSALAGALGASLSSMVANLTFGKKKWDSIYEEMCEISEESQILKDRLLILIDSDTNAFNNVLEAYRLTAKTKDLEIYKKKAILEAMKGAVEIPFNILECCYKILECVSRVIKAGNPNAISDAGVAAEMAYAGVRGALLNIEINLKEINDKNYCKKIRRKSNQILLHAENKLFNIREIVLKKIND
ncbi:uncharacterized protein METZ01_LOCUS507749, partial [marine metagenome]